MTAPGPPRVSRDQVTAALRHVLDPELGMSVVDLGLIYRLDIAAGRVGITMTLTTPSCPLHDAIVGWVKAAVGTIPGVEDVAVVLTFEPPWTPDRIDRAALF